MNEITEIAEALKFFGLNENYTEEKLKKVYHKLAKLCHPDRDGSEEKMKLLNHHYEILRKNLKDKNKINLEKEKINFIIKFQRCCHNSFLSQDEILKYINRFETEIKYLKTIDEIKQCYKKHIRIIYERCVAIINSIINPELQINDDDYKLDYQEFYKLLNKKIKNSYLKKIDEVEYKYKLCHGYQILEKLILKEIQSRKEDFENIENYPHLFKRRIDSDVLNSYENALKKLDKAINNIFEDYFDYSTKLTELLNNTDDEQIKKKILNFINKFNKNVNFKEAYDFIMEISKEIHKEKYSSYLEELKEDILNKCQTVKIDDYILLYLEDSLVGVYFPKTDTMNVLLNTSDAVVWNHYNLSWFVFSTKFNVMDEGMYQQATAAWVIGACGAFTPFNLKCNNLILEPFYSPYINIHKNKISGLGYCTGYGNNLDIDILDYNIKFEAKKHYDIYSDFNAYMAILNKNGLLKPDNGQLHDYLRKENDWHYTYGYNTCGSDKNRYFIDKISPVRNHADFLAIEINKEITMDLHTDKTKKLK